MGLINCCYGHVFIYLFLKIIDILFSDFTLTVILAFKLIEN